jgi:hypothetical protein
MGWVVSVTPWPRFTPWTHWIGGCVGLTSGLDTEPRGRILCSTLQGYTIPTFFGGPEAVVARYVLYVVHKRSVRQ